MLGVTPEPWQSAVLEDVAKPGAHISVRSGHGVGKSALDSWIILWHHATHFPCKTPCCAPTLHQLQDVVWAELATWLKRAPTWLRDQFEVKSSDQDLRLYLREAKEESFAVGRTGRKENPEALQGFHSPNLLFILDEASGIHEIVFEVARGALSTRGARVVLTSNPTRTSGYFYRTHHQLRDMYSTHKVSCFDSRLVGPQYATEVAKDYGEDSNVYRVRVLGEFPKGDDDTVISLDLLERAADRELDPMIQFQPIWGLDVARYGSDRSALARRHGDRVLDTVEWWQGADTMGTVGRVMDAYRAAEDLERVGVRAQVPSRIVVDSIGIGAGVADRLIELGLPVTACNVAESPAGAGSRYMRLRDQLWWRAREWLEGLDVQMVEDAALWSELVSVRYALLSSGKIQVESKDDMRKRGMRSPDLADAFVLTFAAGLDRLDDESRKMERYRKQRRGDRGSWRSL